VLRALSQVCVCVKVFVVELDDGRDGESACSLDPEIFE
jgi:hypothetical protein